MILQEAISVGLDTVDKVFVAYYDVAKAFDSVWIDGLFYQLRQLGVTGKIWHIFYHTYLDFQCRVRLGGIFSGWYPMTCSIHQGGFLSLLKYAAFIDPLLRRGRRGQIVGVPVCPVGYADDMAARCLSKMKLDRALAMAYDHSVKWQYAYNAKKSSVMVYGETKRVHDLGSKYRTFRLGPNRVREDTEYDHVGVKNCLYNNFIPRTQECISKGRKSFNSILSSGIRKNGVNMAAASTLFWTIVVPTVTYGSELWVMGGDEIDLLLKFQRYAGAGANASQIEPLILVPIVL